MHRIKGSKLSFSKKYIISLVLSCYLCVFNAQANVVCTRNQDCPQASNWQVGLAVGIGARTNPLVDGDPLPLLVLPDIAYYSERFYFDNGELGSQFTLSPSVQLSAFVTPNRERGFFSFWHPSNFFLPLISGTVPVLPSSDNEAVDAPARDQTLVSVEQAEDRDWAIDAGLRVTQTIGDSKLSAAIFTDASGVYNDIHARLAFTTKWQLNKWAIYTSPQLMWLSDGLTNYYYGIRSAELTSQGLGYTGKSGFQFGAQLLATRPITTDWQLIMRVGAIKLHKGMHRSPIVKRSTVLTGFVGMAYRF